MVRYEAAAEKGEGAAAANVGRCYERAVGVEQNLEEAVRWYCKAADGDDKAGLASLARCYDQGKGVAQDAHAGESRSKP
eukprot:128617-Prorocentrum_minimum.AAC.1